MRRVFLAALSPRSKCNLLFPFRIILQTCQSFEPPAPLQGEIDISARGLFWTKFNSEPLLFETFFNVMRIFKSVQPKSCRTILHTGTRIPLCLITLSSISYQYAQSIYKVMYSQSSRSIRKDKLRKKWKLRDQLGWSPWLVSGIMKESFLKNMPPKMWPQRRKHMWTNLFASDMPKKWNGQENCPRRLLLHNNALTHKTALIQKLLWDFQWNIFPQAVYSPDFALSDYY